MSCPYEDIAELTQREAKRQVTFFKINWGVWGALLIKIKTSMEKDIVDPLAPEPTEAEQRSEQPIRQPQAPAQAPPIQVIICGQCRQPRRFDL
jgi:hypothetical protein